MKLYVQISFIYIFYLFSGFYQMFDFTHIAASNTASDDVTNEVTHIIFITDLLYPCAHFLVEND